MGNEIQSWKLTEMLTWSRALSKGNCQHTDLNTYSVPILQNYPNTVQLLCLVCDWWVTFRDELSLNCTINIEGTKWTVFSLVI